MSARIQTPKFRVSFPHVFNPQISEDTGKESYNLVMLFDAKEDLSEMKAIVKEAIKEKFGNKVPKNLQLPFKDGNEKEYDGYQDTIYASAKSKSRPGIVDGQLNPIIDENEFYAGCYARAKVTAYGWSYMGKNGISFGLQNLQKINDGEPFSGKVRAEDDFEALNTGSNNESVLDDFEI
jgi:hypothetical protein